MKKLVSLCIIASLVVGALSPRVQALAPFKKEFQKKYVDKIDNADLKAAFKKASCNTCHVKGEKKDQRNDYGDELAKLIEGDANMRIKAAGKVSPDARKAEQAKVLKELEKAFDEVGKMKPKDSDTTYEEKIKSGELPVPLPE